MRKGVKTKFWKRGLAAALAVALISGNFLELGSSLRVSAEDNVPNSGITISVDTDFSTLTQDNVPEVNIPLNIPDMDEAEWTEKTKDLNEEQKTQAQTAYQNEMKAGFEQQLNQLLDGKTVVEYTNAQDAANIGVITAVSFDESGAVEDVAFIGVNTGIESRKVTVELKNPIGVDQASSSLRTVGLNAEINMHAFDEPETPEQPPVDPDKGSETETPEQPGEGSETPEQPGEGNKTPEQPDEGGETETAGDNGQELTPDDTPNGVSETVAEASYTGLNDYYSIGTDEDSSKEDEQVPPTEEETTPPTKEETTPPTEEVPPTDEEEQNYWNISAVQKANEGTISFTPAEPAKLFAAPRVLDNGNEMDEEETLISALSFMVPGESIAFAAAARGNEKKYIYITKWAVDKDGKALADNSETFKFVLSENDLLSEDTKYEVHTANQQEWESNGNVKKDDDKFYIELKSGQTARFDRDTLLPEDQKKNLTVTEELTPEQQAKYEAYYDDDDELDEPDFEDADKSFTSYTMKRDKRKLTVYNQTKSGGSSGSGEIKPPEIVSEPQVAATKELTDRREVAGIYDIKLTVDGVNGNATITDAMPLNVLLVWDASSSMDGDKWNQLLAASRSLVNAVLGDGDGDTNTKNQVAIDAYTEKAAHVRGWTNNKSEIQYWLDKTDRQAFCTEAKIPESGTNCQDGAIKAQETMNKLENPDKSVNVVVYLSDGRPYHHNGTGDDHTTPAVNAIQALQGMNYVTLYTIGIECEYEKVLEAAGTGYFLGNQDASKLTEIFKEIVKVTRNIPVINQNVIVTDPMSEHVNLTGENGEVFNDANYSITDAGTRAEWLNDNKAKLGLTFTYQGYQKNADGTLKLNDNGKPVPSETTASASSSGNITGTFPDKSTYDDLLAQVKFEADGDIVKLVWNPGNETNFLDGKYTLTYTVNVKADQPDFENAKTYPANGITVVKGQYKLGEEIKGEATANLDPVQVYQTQNTLTIKKTGTNDAPLKGAEFVVSFTDDAGDTQYLANGHSADAAQYTDKNSAQRFTTGTDGTVTINGLYDYVYTVEEVKAPDTYTALEKSFTVDFTKQEGKSASGTINSDGTGSATVADDGNGEVTVKNAPSKGKIVVTKELKAANGTAIKADTNPTFKVQLTKDNDTTFTAQSKELKWENGAYTSVTFDNLDAGNYTITEYLEGGTKADTKYTVTVKVGDEESIDGKVTVTAGQETKVNIVNQEKKDGKITVTKELKGSAANNGTPKTSGTFHFGLYQNNQLVTDKDGNVIVKDITVSPEKTKNTATFENLPYGTYTVKEVVKGTDDSWAPVGNDFNYEVTVDNETPIDLNVDNKNGEVTFTNTEKNNGQISVTKKVVNPTGSVEEPAPQPTDETFYVALYQGDGIVTTAKVTKTSGTVTTAADGIYQIKDKETLTFSNLPYGTYTVKEVVEGTDGSWAPVNDADPNFGFTVTYNPDTADSEGILVKDAKEQKVTVTNTRKAKGSVVLNKVISQLSNVPTDDKTFTFTITGPGIETTGIKVEIYPDDKGVLKPVDLIKALKEQGHPLQYGKTYTITEVDHDLYTLQDITSSSEDKKSSAPEKLSFLASLFSSREATDTSKVCTFTPDRDEAITITATNTAKTGSVVLNKVDNAGTALEGVTFGLFKTQDEATDSAEPAYQVITDANGVAEFKDIPVGTYYLKETAVPTGYQVSEAIFKVVVEAGKEVKVTKDTTVVSGTPEFTTDGELINNPEVIKPEITIEKKAADGDKEFILKDGKSYKVTIAPEGETGTQVDLKAPDWTATLNKDGADDFALMPNVKYTVSETLEESANWTLDKMEIGFKGEDSTELTGITVADDHSFTLTPEQAARVKSIAITVTNKAKRSEAKLVVTEQVIGNLLDEDKNTFSFTLEGPDGTFNGTAQVTNNEQLTVSWKQGETPVDELPNLIPGETYTVTQNETEYSFNDVADRKEKPTDGTADKENKSFRFTVPVGATDTYYIDFTNYATTIPVKLMKQLENGAQASNEKFTFVIEGPDAPKDPVTVTVNGSESSSEPISLKKGETYTIKETDIPEGYQLVGITMNGEKLTEGAEDTYSFTIGTDAADIQLVATNRVLGSYEFVKMGRTTTITQRPNGTVISRVDTTAPLAGAIFTLSQGDTVFATATSETDGKVSFENLPAGEYQIEETTAPGDYFKWAGTINLTLAIKVGKMEVTADPSTNNGTDETDEGLNVYNVRTVYVTEEPPVDPDPEPEPRSYSGGGDDTPTIINDEPTPTATIEDEPVPLAPLPNDMVTIEDEEVPLADLPYTGGLPFELVGVLGAVLLGAGIVLRKKSSKQD